MGIMHIMILVGNHLTTQHKTLINQKICKTVKETLPRTMVPIVRQLLTSEVSAKVHIILLLLRQGNQFSKQEILTTLKLQVPHHQKHRIPKRRHHLRKHDNLYLPQNLEMIWFHVVIAEEILQKIGLRNTKKYV